MNEFVRGMQKGEIAVIVRAFHFFDLPPRLRAAFLHARSRGPRDGREFNLRASSFLPRGML